MFIPFNIFKSSEVSWILKCVAVAVAVAVALVVAVVVAVAVATASAANNGFLNV